MTSISSALQFLNPIDRYSDRFSDGGQLYHFRMGPNPVHADEKEEIVTRTFLCNGKKISEQEFNAKIKYKVLELGRSSPMKIMSKIDNDTKECTIECVWGKEYYALNTPKTSLYVIGIAAIAYFSRQYFENII